MPGAAGGGGPSGTPAAARRDPITIGLVGTLSGVAGSALSPMKDGVRIWVAATNARGGLNGAEVKLIAVDDGADPARHRAQVQELVERRGVIAFVANGEPFSGEASVEYHNRVRVPVIGSEGSGQYFYTSPMHFPQMSHGDRAVFTAFAAAADEVLPKGKKRLGTIACVEGVNVCEVAYRMAGDAAAKLGLELAYRARSSLAQPDFTSECLNASSARVDVMVVIMDPNSLVRLADSCARQGFHPVYAAAAGIVGQAVLSSPNLNGMVYGSLTYPYVLDDTPAAREFHDALDRFLPKAVVDGNHATGWAAAKVFERAAANLPPKPTSVDVLNGLWSIQVQDMGGFTPPLTYTRDKPTAPLTCWWNMRVKDGRFAASDGIRQCLDG